MNDLYSVSKKLNSIISQRNYSCDIGWYIPLSSALQLEAFIQGLILSKESNKENPMVERIISEMAIYFRKDVDLNDVKRTLREIIENDSSSNS